MYPINKSIFYLYINFLFSEMEELLLRLYLYFI